MNRMTLYISKAHDSTFPLKDHNVGPTETLTQNVTSVEFSTVHKNKNKNKNKPKKTFWALS